MVVTVGVAVAVAVNAVYPPGPVHENPVAPPNGVAVSVTVPVPHNGPLFDALAVGIGLTDTTVVDTVDGKQPALLTVNE